VNAENYSQLLYCRVKNDVGQTVLAAASTYFSPCMGWLLVRSGARWPYIVDRKAESN